MRTQAEIAADLKKLMAANGNPVKAGTRINRLVNLVASYAAQSDAEFEQIARGQRPPSTLDKP